MNRILFLVALFLSSASFAFSSESSSKQLAANPLFEITFTPVSCPEGHDGSAELVSIDPEIILSELTWQWTTVSPDLSVSLENEVLVITGLDYLNEHCLSFTSAEDASFIESFCFQNDQLRDQSAFSLDDVFYGVPNCSNADNIEMILDFDNPFIGYSYDFDFVFADADSGDEIIPSSIFSVSGQSYICSGFPAGNIETTWTKPGTGCSWTEVIVLEANYQIPDEVSLTVLEQDAQGAEIEVNLPDDSEEWLATYNGAEVSEFPLVVYVATGSNANLEICNPESTDCCELFALEIPEYIPVYGCTDIASCTYNENATDDDESCLYFADCGDFNGDGYTGIDDLLDLLSNFGMYGENLAGDMNYDGVVDTMDLLIFLVVFG